MLDPLLRVSHTIWPPSVDVQPLGCSKLCFCMWLCSGSGKRHQGCRATHAFVGVRGARQSRCEGLQQGHSPGVLSFSPAGDLIIPRHPK